MPIEFKRQFTKKPQRALVGIAGFAVRSGEYYLLDDTLLDRFTKRPNPLIDGRLAEWFIGDMRYEYYIHIDLSIRRDRAGFAMGHLQDRIKFIDLAFAIDPGAIGEVDIEDVINLVVTLKEHRQFNLRLVTFDQFQSSFVMQVLRKLGVRVDYLSVDKDSSAYDCWRDALYQGKLDIYDVPLYRWEAKHLVYVGRKVDHTSKFSKDLCDSIAAVCKHLAIRDRGSVVLRGVTV